MFNCGDLRVLIDAYLFDELSKDEKNAFEAHLKTCSECSATLNEQRTYLSCMSRLNVDVPETFTASWKAAIQKENPALLTAAAVVVPIEAAKSVKVPRMSVRAPWQKWIKYAAAAAAIFIIAFASTRVMSNQSKVDTSQSLQISDQTAAGSVSDQASAAADMQSSTDDEAKPAAQPSETPKPEILFSQIQETPAPSLKNSPKQDSQGSGISTSAPATATPQPSFATPKASTPPTKQPVHPKASEKPKPMRKQTPTPSEAETYEESTEAVLPENDSVAGDSGGPSILMFYEEPTDESYAEEPQSVPSTDTYASPSQAAPSLPQPTSPASTPKPSSLKQTALPTTKSDRQQILKTLDEMSIEYDVTTSGIRLLNITQETADLIWNVMNSKGLYISISPIEGTSDYFLSYS